MTFYVKCHYKTRQGSNHDEGDGTDYSGFSHEEHYDHRFEISDKKMDYPDGTFGSVGDKSYVIAVIYGDGGTFGRTDGYVQYIGPFCEEKADKIAALILKSKSEPRYAPKAESEAFDLNYAELHKLIGGERFYAQWLGYFSSFEGTFVLCSDGSYTPYE
jgi:hypothetical protein